MGAGDVQWMTAGSGILHQEMPKGDPNGRMHGFQLWSNLPARLKMTDPRYQDIKSADIPEITDDDGTHVRVITGEFWGKRGPVEGVASEPRYVDVSVPPNKRKSIKVDRTHNAFAYVFAGSGCFKDASDPRPVATEQVGEPLLNANIAEAEASWQRSQRAKQGEVGNRSLILFDHGDEIEVQAGEEGIRFLLVSGAPLEEPVAWYGPIVMNSQQELQQAYRELQEGTFIKRR